MENRDQLFTVLGLFILSSAGLGMPRDDLVRVSEKKRWTQHMVIFCKSVTLNPQTHTEFLFYCDSHTQVDSLSSFIVLQPIFPLQHLLVF